MLTVECNATDALLSTILVHIKENHGKIGLNQLLSGTFDMVDLLEGEESEAMIRGHLLKTLCLDNLSG